MGLLEGQGSSAPTSAATGVSGADVPGADDLRLRSLKAGLEIIEANEVSTIHFAVGHVRLGDVAAEMGVSRAALYKLWSSQLELRVDLAVHMVATTHEPLLPADLCLGHGDDFGPSVRRAFGPIAEHQVATQDEHAFRASLLAYGDGEGVLRRCAAIERATRYEDARRLVAALAASGRQVSEPLTPLDLATLLRVAADGQVLLERRFPGAHTRRIAVGDEAPCDLLAYTAGCLLEELTEPTSASPEGPVGALDDGPSEPDLPSWTARQHEVLERAGALAREALRADGDPQLGALGYVTLDQVARMLGEHRRSLYRLWPDHGAFRLDLLEFLTVRHRRRYEQAFDAAAAEALAHPERLTMTVAEGVTSTMYQLDGDPAPIPRLAMLPYANTRSMRPVLDDLTTDSLEGQVARIDALLQLLGWTPRHGCTARNISALIGFFGGGGERMHHLDPTAIRRDLPYFDGRYSTIAIAHHAVEKHTIDKGDTT